MDGKNGKVKNKTNKLKHRGGTGNIIPGVHFTTKQFNSINVCPMHIQRNNNFGKQFNLKRGTGNIYSKAQKYPLNS